MSPTEAISLFAAVSALLVGFLGLRGSLAKAVRDLTEANRVLREEVDGLTDSERRLRVRVRALEKIEGDLAAFKAGVALLINQLVANRISPVWRPPEAEVAEEDEA